MVNVYCLVAVFVTWTNLPLLLLWNFVSSSLADVDIPQGRSNSYYWCYEKDASDDCGPKTWPGLCHTGKYQSPIDIVPRDVVGTTEDEVPVELSPEYCKPQSGFFVENNGHSIVAYFNKEKHSPELYFLPGGAFPGKFIFSQLHIHWGPRRGHGSEHHVNGSGYVMEMHMVHMREKNVTSDEIDWLSFSKMVYQNISAGTDRQVFDPKIAVVSVFFKVVNGHDNYAVEPFISAAVHANETDQAQVYKDLPLMLFALFPEDKTVYQYEGSLTTPPCSETVWWTLFKTPMRISQSQIDMLLRIDTMEHKRLTGNYRQNQPLNNRTVALRTLDFGESCRLSAWKYYQRLATWVDPHESDDQYLVL